MPSTETQGDQFQVPGDGGAGLYAGELFLSLTRAEAPTEAWRLPFPPRSHGKPGSVPRLSQQRQCA